LIALLITVDYPPNKGGVSRYYKGLVEVSESQIGVAGVDLGEKPPAGNGIRSRIRQILWAKKIIKQVPKNISILIGQPHLGIGSILARRHFSLFIHGGEWGNYPLGTTFVKAILNQAKLLIVNSSATAEKYVPKKLKDRIIILIPGLSHSFLGEINTKKNASNLEEKPHINILSVARLSPRKGLIKLIQAVEMLISNGQRVRLNIVGNGSEYENLVREIKSFNLIQINTELTDHELKVKYSEADLFALLPMEIKGGEAWEGFGIVFLEAGAAGLPIITSNTGGIKESTTPLGSIYLHEKCTKNEIHDELSRLISDKNKMSIMGSANRDWAINHTWINRKPIVDHLLEEIQTKC
jgi:glycosyltransferase involved in cell wall biosynthesis